MDQDIQKRLDKQDELLQKIYKSVEKTRKYFLWTLIISIVMIVLPLIGLAFLTLKVLGILNTGFGGLFF